MRYAFSSPHSDPPRTTLILIIGQALCFGLAVLDIMPLGRLVFVPALVFKGEFWRVVTSPFVPPNFHPLWLPFVWYFLFLIGTALEQAWGTRRYVRFLLTGYGATLAVALLTPQAYIPNTYLLGSLFLAFALLHPDLEIYLFFILPVKVKWVAMVTAAGYAFEFFLGSNAVRLGVLAAMANLIFHFRYEWRLYAKTKRRRSALEAQRASQAAEPLHRCTVCGITDRTHPDMDFRYCSQCNVDYGYCTDHIHHHRHKR